MNLSFPDPHVDDDLDNPGDQTWIEFTVLSSTDSVFSRSIVEMIRKVPSMESEWNSLLSPWITSLPLPDPCIDNDLENPGHQKVTEFIPVFID